MGDLRLLREFVTSPSHLLGPAPPCVDVRAAMYGSDIRYGQQPAGTGSYPLHVGSPGGQPNFGASAIKLGANPFGGQLSTGGPAGRFGGVDIGAGMLGFSNSMGVSGAGEAANPVPGFNSNDFPSLSAGLGAGGGLGGGSGFSSVASGGPAEFRGASPSSGYHGMGGLGMSSPEFSLQTEDFPSLGGPGGGSQSGEATFSPFGAGPGGAAARMEPGPLLGAGFRSGDLAKVGPAKPGQGAVRSDWAGEKKVRSPDKRGLAKPSDPAPKAAHSGGVSRIQVQDGRGGLQREGERGNSASGVRKSDLPSMGMDADTRFSPWADRAAQSVKLPQCYTVQTQRLQHIHMDKLQLETLLYIFYSMPGDEAQIFAAQALQQRGWWYHKELKIWMTAAGGAEPALKTNTYERGSYIFFDYSSWEQTRRDNFLLIYEHLERAIGPDGSPSPE